MRNDITQCPCNANKIFKNCCGRYIFLGKTASTAEALMRSRYSAYALGEIDYIQKTMSGIDFNPIEAKAWAIKAYWQKLIVVNAIEENQTMASVEFMAFYMLNGKQEIIHEKSDFHRSNGQWLYISGVQPQLQRNAACPCGSGMKVKKCCGNYL